MSTTVWVVIAIIVVAVIVAALLGAQAQRRRRLRETFGPEYDRAIESGSSRREAEADLAGRMKRRDALAIRELDPAARERYVSSWKAVQAQFVDDPVGALRRADALVNQVMTERGYPMSDFEQRAADVSVDHADVVDSYRRAHAVATRLQSGQVTTEEMREAMLHYRSLFASLLGATQATPEVVR